MPTVALAVSDEAQPLRRVDSLLRQLHGALSAQSAVSMDNEQLKRLEQLIADVTSLVPPEVSSLGTVRPFRAGRVDAPWSLTVGMHPAHERNLGLQSANGRFSLWLDKHQGLTLYNDDNTREVGKGRFYWASRTPLGGDPWHVDFQPDGNLVVYTANRHATWASETHGNEGAFLLLKDNGTLVICASDGRTLWEADSGGGISTRREEGVYAPWTVVREGLPSHGGGTQVGWQQALKFRDQGYSLWLDDQHGLTLWADPGPYAVGGGHRGERVWASGPRGITPARAVFEEDGNLVVYEEGGRVTWASDTHDGPGAFLGLQEGGDLVIWAADGCTLWHSDSAYSA